MENRRALERVLEALGAVLADRHQRYELVTVGGSSLMLLGLIERPTRDLDVVALLTAAGIQRVERLPPPLALAIADVGAAFGLDPKWLNLGPQSLLDFGMPEGFEGRLQSLSFGGLKLHLAGRLDQVSLKLYATVDQGHTSKHFADLRAMQPSAEELVFAARWSLTHDPSPGYREELARALSALGVEAGQHGL